MNYIDFINALFNPQTETKTLDQLIQEGADVNISSEDGLTAIHLATQHRNSNLVKQLLKAGATPDTPDEEGETALMRASENGDTEIARMLIENNANVNKVNHLNYSALMLASREEHTEIVKMLIEKKAILDTASDEGETALTIATTEGNADIAKMLIENNADVNLQTTWDETALMIAARGDLPEIAKMLIEKNAEINKVTSSGYSALRMAAESGSKEMVKMLIEYGAEVDTICDEGNTPLIIAAKFNLHEIAKMLIEKNAEINKVTSSGYSALRMAAESGSKEMVKMLIEYGAEVDTICDEGNTPLIIAAKFNLHEIAKILIKYGADFRIKNIEGKDAIALNQDDGIKAILDILDPFEIQSYAEQPTLGKDITEDLLDIISTRFNIRAIKTFNELTHDNSSQRILNEVRMLKKMYDSCKKIDSDIFEDNYKTIFSSNESKIFKLSYLAMIQAKDAILNKTLSKIGPDTINSDLKDFIIDPFNMLQDDSSITQKKEYEKSFFDITKDESRKRARQDDGDFSDTEEDVTSKKLKMEHDTTKSEEMVKDIEKELFEMFDEIHNEINLSGEIDLSVNDFEAPNVIDS